MKIIGSVKEDLTREKRISITPETVKKFVDLNFSVFIEKKYGEHLGISDEEYLDKGARLKNSTNEVLKNSEVILAPAKNFEHIAFTNGVFNKDGGFKVHPFSIQKKIIKKLNRNLLLVYTGQKRTAHHIAKSYVNNLQTSKKYHILKILSFVKEGENILKNGKLDDFGKLLHESWIEKKNLSTHITNPNIDEIYDLGIRKGAVGGKLLGAGGGWFMLIFAKPQDQTRIKKRLKKFLCIPFDFEKHGSQVIVFQPESSDVNYPNHGCL